MLEQADVAVCITQDDRFQYVNPKFAQMHGYAASQLSLPMLRYRQARAEAAG
jgi:PAS domain S-box-containing protein